jgi:glycosyltransferase involved in cell wall biosynthesis
VSRALVSVVMIFLDEEEFLSEAIESVLTQEHSNWELLLVDDGSTDDSTRIARSYAAEYPAVSYLEHPGHANRGMSASRNLGLAHSRGEYLALLDGDDAWYSDTLTRQVALVERHPEVAMVCGTSLWWRSWAGDGAGGDSCDTIAARGLARDVPIDPPGYASLIVNDGGAAPCVCSVLVRTRCLRSIGGFDDSFRGLYEDQVLYVKLGLESPVVVTTECLGRYRQHDGQCCVEAERAGLTAAAHRRFLSWVAGYVGRRGVRNAILDQALARYGLTTGTGLISEENELRSSTA